MNKYQFQIVGAQQFEYIMGEGEYASPGAAVAAYNELRKAYSGEKAGEGITNKEFDAFLDYYLQTNSGSTEVYAKMSKDQQDRIQMLKRAFARIKNKGEPQIEQDDN